MAFRDDRAAAHHRADALERELAEANRGKEEMQRELDAARAEASGTPKSRHGLLFGLAGLTLVVAGGGFIAAGAALELVPLLLVGISLVGMAGPVIMLGKCLIIVPPGSIAVLSGRRRTGPDGRSVGYRLVSSGRVVRIPILETVDFMDTRLMPLRIELRNVYSKGNVKLNVVATASVRVAPHEPMLSNAVERFLGRSNDEIARVAQETVTGGMRGVIAKLTPEQLQEDKLRVAEAAVQELEHPLMNLGIELDTLSIDEVTEQG